MRRIFALLLTVSITICGSSQFPKKFTFRADSSFRSAALFNLNPSPGFGNHSNLIKPVDLRLPARIRSKNNMIPEFEMKESFRYNPGIPKFLPSAPVYRNFYDSISFKSSWANVNIRDNFIFRLAYYRYSYSSLYKNPAISNTNLYRNYFDETFWGSLIKNIFLGVTNR